MGNATEANTGDDGKGVSALIGDEYSPVSKPWKPGALPGHGGYGDDNFGGPHYLREIYAKGTDDIPLYIGGGHMNKGASSQRQSNPVGRLSRIKAWAQNLPGKSSRRNSASSPPTHRSGGFL